jgi:hypothetical protein
MVSTRLQTLAETYKSAIDKNNKMVSYCRRRKISMTDPRMIQRRGDLFYEIYIAKHRYLRLFHGWRYRSLSKTYNKALLALHLAPEDENESKLQQLREQLRVANQAMYGPLQKLV